MNASVHGGHFSFFYEDKIVMNSKQIVFIFLLMIIAFLVITLPIWIDRALPIMKDSINSAGETFEKMMASLQFIWERLSQDITRFLDKYVYGS